MALKFDFRADNSQFLHAANQTQEAVHNINQEVDNLQDNFKSMIQQAAALGGVSLGLAGVKEFASKVFEVRSYFQDINSSMVAFLGNQEKADKFTNELKDYAWYNMFEFSDLAQASQQMIAYGVEVEKIIPTIDHLSDIAVATHANLGDLVAMYNKAKSVGSVDSQAVQSWATHGLVIKNQLKEIGEAASGSSISFEQLERVIEHATSEGGLFYQQQSKMMDNLSSSWGQLQDDMDSMFNEIGEQLQPIFKSAIEYASELVDNYKEVGTTLGELIATYGVYRAALAAGQSADKTAGSLVYQAETEALRQALGVKKEVIFQNTAEAASEGEVITATQARINALREEIAAEEALYKQQLDNQVARGAITAQQAEEIMQLREKLAVELDLANVEHLKSQDALGAATQEVNDANSALDKAKDAVESAKELEEAALAVGDAAAIDAAKTEVANAAQAKKNATDRLAAAQTAQHAAGIKAETTAKELNTLATRRQEVAQIASIKTMGLAKAAGLQLRNVIASINAAIDANPIGLIAVAVAALAYGIYKLATADSVEEAARKEANKAWEEFTENQKDAKDKVESLTSVIRDNTKSSYEQITAYKELEKILPKLAEKYSRLKLSKMSQAEINAAVVEIQEEEQMEKAQKDLDNYTKAYERYKKQVDSIRSSGNTTSSSYQDALTYMERYKALMDDANDRLLEFIHIKYEAEQEERPIEIRVKEAEDNRDNLSNMMDWINQATDAMQNELDRKQGKYSVTNDDKSFDDVIAQLQEELTTAQEEAAQHPLELGYQEKVNSLQDLLNMFLETKREWESTGKFTIPLKFTTDAASLNKALQDAVNKANDLASSPEVENYGDNYNKAKEAYKIAKKALDDIKKNRDAYTQKQYDDAVTALNGAQSAYKKLGGDVSNNAGKKQLQQQQKLQDIIKKQTQQEEKERIELARSTEQAEINILEESSEKKRRQIELDYKKQLDSIHKWEEDLKNAKIAAARQKWEAENPNATTVFDEKSVDTSLSQSESNYIAAATNAAIKNKADSIKELRNKDTQYMLDYLQQYGDMNAKKFAIEQEYQIKIENEKDQWRKLSLEKEKQAKIDEAKANGALEGIQGDASYVQAMVDPTSVATEGLEKLHNYISSVQDDLATLDPTQLRELANLLSSIDEEMLNRDPFKAYRDSKEVMAKAAEDIKKFTNELQAADAELKRVQAEDTEESYLQALREAEQKKEEVEIKLEELSHEYDDADDVRRIEIVEQQAIAYQELADAEDDVTKAKKNLDDKKAGRQTEKVTKAIDAQKKAQNGLTNATNTYVKAQQQNKKSSAEVLGAIGQMGQNIQNLGSQIGGVTGSVIGLIGNVLTTVTTISSAIQGVSATATGAIKTIESASVILAIISAAIQLAQAVMALIPTQEENYEKAVEKQKNINKATEAMLDYKQAVLEAQHAEDEWFGSSSLRGLANLAEENDVILEKYLNKVSEAQAQYQNKKGGSWLGDFLNPANALWNGGVSDVIGSALSLGGASPWLSAFNRGKYAEGQVSAFENLRIETRKKSSGFLGFGQHDQETADLRQWVKDNANLFDGKELFDQIDGIQWINTDVAKTILDKFSDDLQGQTQETLEALIEIREQYDEYMKELKEYVSNMYAPLVDNFVQGVWDWFDEGADALESFKESASDTFRDIITDFMTQMAYTNIVGEFNEQVTALYDKYNRGDINKDRLMSDIVGLTNDLQGRMEKELPVFQELLNTVSGSLENIGINLTKDKLNVTYDDVRDGFFEMITDMTTTAEEFSEHFSDLMYEALVNTQLKDNYNEEIQSWFAKFKEAAKNGLDEDSIAKLREEYNGIITSMNNDAKALAELVGKNKVVSSISFSTIESDFSKLVQNMDATSKDFANKFGEYMTNALLSQRLQGAINDDLQGWYNSFTALLNANNELSEQQIEGLRQEYVEIGQKAQSTAEEVLKLTGEWDKAMKEQEATLKENVIGVSFDTMKNNFKKAITDMKKTTEDFSEDLRKSIYENASNKMFEENYAPKIEALYDSLYVSLDKGVDEAGRSVDDILEEVKRMYTESANASKEIAQSLGIEFEEVQHIIDGVSFSDLESGFNRVIGDMTLTSEDFADDFSQMMFNAIMKAQLSNVWESQLQGVYDDMYSWVNSEERDQDEYERIKEKHTEILTEIQAFGEEIERITGYQTSAQRTAIENAAKEAEEAARKAQEEAEKAARKAQEEAEKAAEDARRAWEERFAEIENSFNGVIGDMSRDVEDFKNSLQEVSYSKMLNKAFESSIDGELEAWYNRYESWLNRGADTTSAEFDKLMDDYEKLGMKASEIADAIAESLGIDNLDKFNKKTSTTFDSLKNSFMNTISDMNSTAENFADSFTNMIQTALINAHMQDLIDENLKVWYRNFGEAMGDGRISDEEMTNLKNEYDDLVEDALNRREAILGILGNNGTKTQRGGSTAFQGMSQQTGDELNGRFTALQISNESISSSVANIAASMVSYVSAISSLSANGVNQNESLQEIRDMMVINNLHLEDIARYAKLSYSDFGMKLDTIANKLNRL